MFDDLNQDSNKKVAPSSDVVTRDSQAGVEDIFSDSKVDMTQNSEKSNESGEHHDHDAGINSLEIEQQSKRKLLVLLLMFIGLVVIGWGTYFVFGKIVKKIGSMDNTENEAKNILVEKKDILQDEIEAIPEIIKDSADKDLEIDQSDEQTTEEKEELLDSDKDGLSDEEEISLGLSITSVDTDADGLFDREEVKIYKTDPLNPDTDGDGFSDGEEVKAGYNPKGAGRILNINKNQN